MKFALGLKNISIRNKLMLMSALSVVMPLLILVGMLLSQIYTDSIERERVLLEESISRVQENLTVLLDDTYYLTASYLADYSLNWNLRNQPNLSAVEEVTMLSEIQDTINAQIYAYPYIKDIVVYHNSSDVDFQSSIRVFDMDTLSPEVYEFLHSDSSFMILPHKEALVIYRNLNALLSERGNFMEVRLNEKSVNEAMEDNWIAGKNGQTYLLDSQGLVMYSTSSGEGTETVLTKKDILALAGRQLSFAPVTYRGHLSGFELAVVTDPYVFLSNQQSELLTVSVSVLLLLAFALLVAFVFGSDISSRLQRLVHAMDSYEDEDLYILEERPARDEIGKTQYRYNKMAERINHLLQDKNDTLTELETMNEEMVEVYQSLEASYEEIKDQDRRINDLIYKDSLTGLDNKYAIDQLIEDKVHRSIDHQPLAVAFVDIDNFKFINDTYGHDIGDEVIRGTGQKIGTFSSDSVHIGRFGGDEFLMLIESPDEMNRLMKGIKELFKTPVEVASNAFYLTVSIGVALYPDHALTKSDLIKKADLALYEAKNKGRNRVAVFESSMGSAVDETNQFRELLKEGFKNGEFTMAYQPYYDVSNRQVEGYEALIRWYSPVLGQVSPFKLITHAEQMGMILELGDWIFREACKFSKRLNTPMMNTRMVSVNISAVQIMDSKFLKRLSRIVEEIDVDPSTICLEMTETVMIDSLEFGSTLLTELRGKGFKIALDDFGTGYSSLSYLKALPLDILKIDKGFIDGIVHQAYDRDLAEIMIAIAHKRGLKVVAEGVEYEEQYQILSEFGCDTVQGYLFSKALSPEVILNGGEKYEDNTSV